MGLTFESRQPRDCQTFHCRVLHRMRRRTSINGMRMDARYRVRRGGCLNRVALYGWLPASGSVGSAFFTREDRLASWPR